MAVLINFVLGSVTTYTGNAELLELVLVVIKLLCAVSLVPTDIQESTVLSSVISCMLLEISLLNGVAAGTNTLKRSTANSKR